MHILITGGTGFIGQALRASLLAEGHSLTLLTRQSGLKSSASCRYIQSLETLAREQAQVDAVINLAGASLAQGRWTRSRRRVLWESRVDLTRELVAALGRLPSPPSTVLSGSAIGYYGHPGPRHLDESAPPGSGFGSELCQAWEEAALQAEALGTRVCRLRLGVVLDQGGGALPQMSLPFRLGVASWPGDGEQVLSWIHRADVVAAIEFLLAQPGGAGAVNLTAPEAVSQRELCAALRRHFRTWLTLPSPGPLLRLALGEMADELLLKGARVTPARLSRAGFAFRYPDIQAALAAIYAGKGEKR